MAKVVFFVDLDELSIVEEAMIRGIREIMRRVYREADRKKLTLDMLKQLVPPGHRLRARLDEAVRLQKACVDSRFSPESMRARAAPALEHVYRKGKFGEKPDAFYRRLSKFR